MNEVITVERYQCSACNTVYEDRALAQECADQPDYNEALKKFYGFAPKPGDFLIQRNMWGWVATQKPEWHGDAVPKSGLHGITTFPIYYVVTAVEMELDKVYPGEIKRHKSRVYLATRAFECNPDTGKLDRQFGNGQWTTTDHVRLVQPKEVSSKLRKQAANLIFYWNQPENKRDMYLM